ncbi:MAG: hypothetical protein ACRDMV_13805 [Streptosporangiales bacterium]
MTAQPPGGTRRTSGNEKDEQLEGQRVRLEDSHLTTQQGVRVDHTDDALARELARHRCRDRKTDSVPA